MGWAVGKGLQCVSELKTSILQALSRGQRGSVMLVILEGSLKRGKHLDGLLATLLLFHSHRGTKMVNKKMLQIQFLLVSTLFMFLPC